MDRGKGEGRVGGCARVRVRARARMFGDIGAKKASKN
jgi:hypothetical protein